MNSSARTQPYLAHLDWLKAVGITLIVHGHVAAATVGWATPPVYPKQLGVAFFVCAMGYSLGLDRRDRWRVVYNRAFEVLLFGTISALVMSAAGVLLLSDFVESNYLPLAFGSNVVLDTFPANPTTWYIGTYLHLLVLWALVLRRLRVSATLLALSCVVEIAVRALLIGRGHLFPAYMLLTNWTTLLLIGLWFAQRPNRVSTHVWVWRIALPALVLLWPLLIGNLGWNQTFPLMTRHDAHTIAGSLLTSATISALYLSYTVLAYLVLLHLPEIRVVRFLARNTLIIFIAHMPAYYLLEWVFETRLPNYAARVTVEFLVCLVGLAWVSEWIRAIVRPVEWRDRLADRYVARLASVRLTTR